jgi:hypothetical protein
MHSTIAAAMEQQTTPLQLRRQDAALRRFLSSLRTYVQISTLEGHLGARARAAGLVAALSRTHDRK